MTEWRVVSTKFAPDQIAYIEKFKKENNLKITNSQLLHDYTLGMINFASMMKAVTQSD